MATRIELAPSIVDDFDRIIEHAAAFGADGAARIVQIVEAIDVLAHHPLIGRPVPTGTRELIIGRRSLGYVALVRYVEAIDTVFILAIRSQREESG